ncbi:MAG: hydantoinase B/oxoprolinase family protein [Deltaproteobacteria bacterium]|nr:hydantoinase B/oxoprolinase family protein [Deltaproteobacteria bacterium]
MGRLSPADLQIAHHRLAAIAEEMGVALCRSAFSPNIKERRDYSCALFDAHGELAAQAAHIPVHLGSTPLSVRAAIARQPMRPGDVVILNDPYAGGTHLPDVTAVAPVHVGRRLVGYVANRAHHADIGGISPGSMPLATEIYQEGFRLPPVRLLRGGVLDEDVLDLFLANTRVAAERRGDLLAQVAALRVGAARLQAWVEREGARHVAAATRALQDYAERLMRAALRALPAGIYRAEDWLDDDGLGTRHIRLAVRVELGRGRAAVDFAGTAPQVAGGINANFAVTLAAVYYVFRCLAERDVPANAGFMRPIAVRAPHGSVVNAAFPAAVAGGNVETSQRIVDVLLRALARACPARVPAASSGSMNNLAFGGTRPAADPASPRRQFSYYETLAGGAGAGPHGDGRSAVHTHMTNTMNTPIEALEAELPVRVTRYHVRRGSGGRGRHRGGDGLVREIEFLAPAQVTLLTERRRIAPYGLAGGDAGTPGRNQLVRAGRRRALPAKISLAVAPGDRIRLATPGGGGHGGAARGRRRR